MLTIDDNYDQIRIGDLSSKLLTFELLAFGRAMFKIQRTFDVRNKKPAVLQDLINVDVVVPVGVPAFVGRRRRQGHGREETNDDKRPHSVIILCSFSTRNPHYEIV